MNTQHYQAPDVVYEGKLEVRAGSPLGMPEDNLDLLLTP